MLEIWANALCATSAPIVKLFPGEVNIPPHPDLNNSSPDGSLAWPPPPAYSNTVKEIGVTANAAACETACVTYVTNGTAAGSPVSPVSGWSRCQSFTWTASTRDCVLVVDVADWDPIAAPKSAGDGTTCGRLTWPPAVCTSDNDCSRNGKCDASTALCVCRDAWTGDRCQTLALLAATSRTAGLRGFDDGHNTSSWGGSVLLDDDNVTLHMWAAEMEAHCGINSWTTNSRIVHATCVLESSTDEIDIASATASCEFKRKDVVWPRFAHEPNVVRAPSGEWVMYWTGSEDRSAAAQPPLCSVCTDGITPLNCPGGAGGTGPTYLSFAPSATGPWSKPVRLFSDAVQRKLTNMDTNLAVLILPNNSVVGIGRTGGGATGIIAHRVYASDWRDATTYIGEWSTLLFPNTTILPTAGVEDPFLYFDEDGIFHAVFHNQIEDDDERLCGGHAFSEDGVTWSFTGTAWSNAVDFTDTTGTALYTRRYDFSRRERPHFIFSDAAHPYRIIALTTGVQFGLGSPIAQKGQDACYTSLQPVNC